VTIPKQVGVPEMAWMQEALESLMTMRCRISRIVVSKDKGDYSNTEIIVADNVLCRLQPTSSYNRRRGDDAGQFENMKYQCDAKLTVSRGVDIQRGDFIRVLNEDSVVVGNGYSVNAIDLDDSQWNPCIRCELMIMRD